MLSRVAERMYWFGRYLERAENIARLISVNTNLVLDLPRARHIWSSLIEITGGQERFKHRFSIVDERNVIKFLLDDEQSSIRSSIQMARENARTTREIMPTEAWQQVNELNLYLKKNTDKGIRRDGRHVFLTDIIGMCNQLTGSLVGSMSADTAYNFIKIGRNLERADMTTRIVDVGCLTLLNPNEIEAHEYETILWMNVLRSLTGYQMYRQHVKDRVNGADVVDFLLKNRKFPRAVAHCLNEVADCCRQLPRNDSALRSITHGQRNVDQNDVTKLLNESRLHDFIDELQLDLADIHSELSGTWFQYEAKAPEAEYN
ncbi:MAG: alpha-E domain-containing protein [bacterium]|nr:alpha-E domain-containing protein [Gammaproteobacteria bacterium]